MHDVLYKKRGPKSQYKPHHKSFNFMTQVNFFLKSISNVVFGNKSLV